MPGTGKSFFGLSTNQYSQRIIYMVDKDLEEYVCETHAKNQHKTGEAVWRIRKIAYNDADHIKSVTWANRSKDFKFIHDKADTYNYD